MECAARAVGLLQCVKVVHRARLLALAALASGSWLNARPCTNLGQRLGRPLMPCDRLADVESEVGWQPWNTYGAEHIRRPRLCR